jgi:hypothetical protein
MRVSFWVVLCIGPMDCSSLLTRSSNSTKIDSYSVISPQNVPFSQKASWYGPYSLGRVGVHPHHFQGLFRVPSTFLFQKHCPTFRMQRIPRCHNTLYLIARFNFLGDFKGKIGQCKPKSHNARNDKGGN